MFLKTGSYRPPRIKGNVNKKRNISKMVITREIIDEMTTFLKSAINTPAKKLVKKTIKRAPNVTVFPV